MNPFLLIKKNPKLSDNLSIHVRNHKNNIFRNLTLEFLLFHLKMSSNLPELVGGFIPEYAKVQPAFIRTLAAKLTQGRYPLNTSMLKTTQKSSGRNHTIKLPGDYIFVYESEIEFAMITFDFITFSFNQFNGLPINIVKKHDVVSKLHDVETNVTKQRIR